MVFRRVLFRSRELWTVPGYGPERAFQWPPARKSQSRPMKAIAGVGGRGMVFQRGAERSLCGVAVVALLGLTAPPLLAQPLSNDLDTNLLEKIGRASFRDRVFSYGENSVF